MVLVVEDAGVADSIRKVHLDYRLITYINQENWG